jgi:putative sugar O-methyltransferase
MKALNRVKKNIRKLEYKYAYHQLHKYMTAEKRKTSISDDGVYPVFCYVASQETRFFKNFRRNPIYNRILEHVSRKQGKEILDVINANNKLSFTDNEWNNFFKNDLWGKPRVFAYKINGNTVRCSPTTLRYIKVLQDIVTLFDTDKIRKVAEIGIGYGGQCRIMTSYIRNIDNYSLIDLPEVLKLAKRYLGQFSACGEDVLEKVRLVDGTNIDVCGGGKYDFVMSNYAYSELTREVQDIYLEKVILNAEAGYITWNSGSYNSFGGYSLNEIINKIPGSSVIKEKPLTASDNCIIIWGNKKGNIYEQIRNQN